MSLRPSTDWMSLTHVTEGNLLYSDSTDLNVNHIWKISSQQHLSLVFDKTIDQHSIVKVIHKINHQEQQGKTKDIRCNVE